MIGRRAAALMGAAILTLAIAACGGDDSDGATAAPTTETGGSSSEPEPSATEPGQGEPDEGQCPGEEVGDLPLEVDLPEGEPYSFELEPTPLGVATTDDGLVFINLAFSVYCISDDTLFAVATPETLPYPGGDEESSYADIAVSPEGNPLVVDWRNPRVFEIADGEATVVPGSDDPRIGGSRSIDVGADGTIYVTGLDQSGTTGVWAIADGEATPFAGPGERSFANDGGPALDTYLNEPEGIHVAADGSLYIADRNNARVAVVSPDGTVDTLAGGEFFDDRPDSEDLGGPVDITTDPDGVVHLIDSNGDPSGLYRLDADGTPTALSASSSDCYPSLIPEIACPVDQVDLGGVFRLAFDAAGALWLTEDTELWRIVDGQLEIMVEFDTE